MTIDPKSVYAFLKQLFIKIFPCDLYGFHNQLLMLKYLKKLIMMKRFESFSIKEVYDNLDKKSITWFKRKYNPNFQGQCMTHKKRQIIYVLSYIFNQIVQFIKANFFVTEKHNEHNQLFFYSKPVWHLVTQLGIMQLELDNLEKVQER